MITLNSLSRKSVAEHILLTTLTFVVTAGLAADSGVEQGLTATQSAPGDVRHLALDWDPRHFALRDAFDGERIGSGSWEVQALPRLHADGVRVCVWNKGARLIDWTFPEDLARACIDSSGNVAIVAWGESAEPRALSVYQSTASHLNVVYRAARAKKSVDLEAWIRDVERRGFAFAGITAIQWMSDAEVVVVAELHHGPVEVHGRPSGKATSLALLSLDADSRAREQPREQRGVHELGSVAIGDGEIHSTRAVRTASGVLVAAASGGYGSRPELHCSFVGLRQVGGGAHDVRLVSKQAHSISESAESLSDAPRIEIFGTPEDSSELHLVAQGRSLGRFKVTQSAFTGDFEPPSFESLDSDGLPKSGAKCRFESALLAAPTVLRETQQWQLRGVPERFWIIKAVSKSWIALGGPRTIDAWLTWDRDREWTYQSLEPSGVRLDEVASASFSPDESVLWSLDFARTPQLAWRTRSGERRPAFLLPSVPEEWTATSSDEVVFFDAATRQLIRCRVPHGGASTFAVTRPDGLRYRDVVGVAGGDGEILVVLDRCPRVVNETDAFVYDQAGALIWSWHVPRRVRGFAGAVYEQQVLCTEGDAYARIGLNLARGTFSQLETEAGYRERWFEVSRGSYLQISATGTEVSLYR